MKEKIIQLIAPKGEGGRLPKPAYTVRVQVQKNNPLQIQADNEFLTQVATICAQSGKPASAGNRDSVDGGLSEQGRGAEGDEGGRRMKGEKKMEENVMIVPE